MRRPTGQILVLTIVVTAAVLVNTLLIISNSLLFNQNSFYSLETTQALSLAEAGVDKAITSLNSYGGTYTGEAETKLGKGSFSVTVTSQGSNTKQIEASGYVPAKSNSRVKRTIKINVAKGTGVSFKYGIQVGEGGLQMGSHNQVTGSLYSNGNVTGINNNVVTGDIYVAGGTNPTPDEQTECSDISCGDFLFGKNIFGENRLDVAQSFKPSQSAVLNKIAINLKKVGNPADITVRILADAQGKPDKNSVLTTGTIPANLLSTEYSLINVSFAEVINISANTLYWIVLDSVSNSANYWSWRADNSQSYSKGSAIWSDDWRAKNPLWTLTNQDLSFQTYVGGVSTYIDGGNGVVVQGDAHANTLKNVTIQKAAYYQSIVGSTAATYYPNSADPPPKNFPISDANILDWQNQAQLAGVYTGDISGCVSTLGPGKYLGNIYFDTGCIVTVKSPVWISGNLTLKNHNRLNLSSEYDDLSGVIMVDGIIELNNGNLVQGTGKGSSILMLLSLYDSRTSGIAAISVKNTGNSSFLYADKGIIEPGNSNIFKELTAWGIQLFSSSMVNYETGLAGAFFSSGPSGAYSLVKGTYQLK